MISLFKRLLYFVTSAKWIQTLAMHWMPQVRDLVHSEPTVVIKELQNSESCLSQLTTNHSPMILKHLRSCYYVHSVILLTACLLLKEKYV